MLIIHNPLEWARRRRQETDRAIRICKRRPVRQAIGCYPSQKAKNTEVAFLYGKLGTLEELIDGLEADGRRHV